MLKDITLGQFFPGNTLIHRLDPRTKLIMTLLYIAALFLANGIMAYLVMLLFLFLCVYVSKIRPATMLKGLKPLIFLIALSALLNIFYTDGTVILRLWILKITAEGIYRGVFMAVRIIMLVTGTFLLTYTTSPIALTDALESLLSPLKKIRLPIHELAMMMSIALRFIPTIIEETDKIMSAQKSRGASFDTGKLTERARAMLPLLIPLFVSAFRRADELAIAMECRCYNGGEGRTRMKLLKYQGIDALTLCFGAFIIGAIIFLRVSPLQTFAFLRLSA